MIISHKHKFIFIHCRKVAGSSIKVALAPFLGKNDIIIGSINEIIDSGIPINLATKRAFMNPKSIIWATIAKLIGKTWPEAVNIGIKKYYLNRLSKNPPHPTALQVKSAFPYEWNNYFKFAFVRNPYERVVSDYLWRVKTTKQNLEFSDYLNALNNALNGKKNNSSIIHPEAVSNWNMITINDELAIDHIGKYENLEEDFLNITNAIGIKNISLVNKEKVNSVNGNYSHFYGHNEKSIVAELFNKEIKKFGYKFPY